MNDKRPDKRLRVLIVILLVLFSIVAIMPLPLKSKFQTNKLCVDNEGNSLQQQESQEGKCSSDSNKQLINLFFLGLINIDDLTMWVLGVDRRAVVLKMMHEKRMIQASDIADSTDRSLQNISYAMRELEEKGLIKCLTPEKHTWKKYIPTEKGTEVFEKLKENHLLDRLKL
ncbi:MAG: winged helix-turn-helix transcriptional regulator [Candidatus Methanoperedens sp.]|nr:winged helix-turn-helix transcriptional regulator [Candidatus Methanoperedens sp.]